jgi:peroxiredoxin
MLLAVAGAALADEAGKTKVPVPTPPTSENSPISPTPQGSRILSQIYVGEQAPDFELDGSQGRTVRLAHLKGYWLLLVFADRRAELSALKGIEPELRDLGVKPYGICADKAHVLRSHAERENLPFTLLSDVTGEISQLYGLYDTRLRSIRPGFVLINRQGMVRVALLGEQLPFDEMMALVKNAVTGT